MKLFIRTLVGVGAAALACLVFENMSGDRFVHGFYTGLIAMLSMQIVDIIFEVSEKKNG